MDPLVTLVTLVLLVAVVALVGIFGFAAICCLIVHASGRECDTREECLRDREYADACEELRQAHAIECRVCGFLCVAEDVRDDECPRCGCVALVAAE